MNNPKKQIFVRKVFDPKIKKHTTPTDDHANGNEWGVGIARPMTNACNPQQASENG
jgi:hypothetical protein